jgi:hypothetical protein
MSSFTTGNLQPILRSRVRYTRGMNANKVALLATLHCLTGCAIGEVAGMVLGTAYGWSNLATVAAAIGLAFLFGYALSLLPLVRNGIPLKKAMGLVLAADTLSIATMEIVDNLVMVAVPGAMDSGLTSPLFWGALAFSLFVAFWAAFPVNKFLIARGKGHALVHAHHESHDSHHNHQM